MNLPAVVMGNTETALSIARALGRRGIKVIGVGPKRLPSTYSRFLTFMKEPQTESGTERLDFFVRLGKNLRSRAVILPTFDPNVMFLSRYRTILSEYFLFLLPPHDLLESLVSKSGLIAIAKKYKIPLPFTLRINHRSDLKNIPSTAFPCVLKPESQHSWLTESAKKNGIWGLKAIRAMNETELFRQYDRVKEVDSKLIVQKMVMGPDRNHIDYHALSGPNGEILGEFVGKKLRLTPPHFGMGCYVVSEKSNEVIQQGRNILKALHYKGMANINFKQDERDGKLYFFELNPRFSFWTGLDVACGVDFPYYYYQICRGEKPEIKNDYTMNKTWLSLYHDIFGIRTGLKDGSLTWHQWIISVIRADVGALFAKDDPLPAIVLPGHIFKRAMEKFFSK